MLAGLVDDGPAVDETADTGTRRPMGSRRRCSRVSLPIRDRPSASRPRRNNSNNSSSELIVLSRIAESLYWIGRYTERAESTGAHPRRVLAQRARGPPAARRSRRASGCSTRSAPAMPQPVVGTEVEALIAFVVDDPRYPGSIAHSLEAAWANARGAREAISSEMWESINTTHATLAARRGGSAFARHNLLGWVRDRAAIVAGLADASMSHDDGWRFIVLGRTLERVDMTVRLLSTRLGDAWGDRRLGRDAAVVRGVRGLSPHLSPRRGRKPGGRVPAPRPVVPAIGVPRAERGGERVVRSRSRAGPPRNRERGAPARGSCVRRARVRARRRARGVVAGAPRATSSSRARRRTWRSPNGSSMRQPRSGGARDDLAAVGRARDHLRVRR